MLKNYFTIAVRTLMKRKLFTTINVLGLSIGISAALVIYLLVNFHFTFDKFEQGGNRIYRVVSNFSFSGESYKNSGIPNPMAASVRKEVTGLEMVVPFRTFNDAAKFSVPGKDAAKPAVFKKQENIVFADSNYFKMLQYEWLAGSAGSAVNEPYNTVLTESNAKLYFPGLSADEVIGKQIYIDDTIRVSITGIVKNKAQNTDFNFQTFIAYATLEHSTLKPEDWDAWNNVNGAQQLWIKLLPGASAAKVDQQINVMLKRNDKKEAGDNSKSWTSLQPLKDLHFNGDFGNYGVPLAHKPTLNGLLAVALFLLLLGCINFINLTTANAAQRSKEIGVRKTMGSTRKQLILQFLNETFLLTFIATILSLCLTPLLLKAFDGFIPKQLSFNILQQPGIILFLVLLVVIVTVLSGLYPALFLSAYKPVLVLKNQAYTGTGKTRNAWLRKSLTITQFVIAQIFIMAAILVSKQITFSVNQDLGFKKDAILYFSTNYYDTVRSNKYLLLDKLKTIPEIQKISLSNNPPSSNSTWSSTMKYNDGKKEIETDVQQKYGDSNFTDIYGLKLIAGSKLSQTDTVTEVLINETYAGILGFGKPVDAINKKIYWDNKSVPIVGVVADFHQKSFREPIKPLIIASREKVERTFNILLQPRQADGKTWSTAITKMTQAWKEVYPKEDFEYTFFDENIAKFYEGEQNIRSLLQWATGLAIFISCLGLLGLVMYTTTQRTKEIGVRKVLGASAAQIVTMISKEFLLLVLLAFVIAAPIAGYGMNQWLQSFAYRTNISWWVFFVGGAIMIIVAIVTLSFQTIKAAMANPVKSLRTE